MGRSGDAGEPGVAKLISPLRIQAYRLSGGLIEHKSKRPESDDHACFFATPISVSSILECERVCNHASDGHCDRLKHRLLPIKAPV